MHTVRAVIDLNILSAEPFLSWGIVAAIWRILVITAEAEEGIGTRQLHGLMLEMGGPRAAITLFLVPHTESPEPAPAHEREP